MVLRARALRPALLTLLLHTIRTSATPFALDTETVQIQNETIVKRCANPCGYYGQVCCGSDQTCYTDSNNQAQCRSGGGGGGGGGGQQGGGDSGYWKYSTSIWTETDTNVMTSIYSSYVGQTPASVEAACTQCGGSGVVPTPAVGASPTAMPLNCDWEAGESSCGNICCSNGEYCEVSGQCGAAASSGKVSAAVRPTSSSGTDVVTQEAVSTTTTRPFTPALATGQALPVTETSADDGGGGLSGGAIAGIVIGVILALIILILLLLCLCFKAAWDAIVALLCGRRRRKGRRETVEYESYHRSGRGGGQRERTWYGGLANRPSRVERTTTTTTRRKTTAAAGLSGLAVALGLKKKNDDRRRRRDEKSDYTSSYGSYSSYSDPSSSDRRTRDTRRSTRR